MVRSNSIVARDGSGWMTPYPAFPDTIRMTVVKKTFKSNLAGSGLAGVADALLDETGGSGSDLGSYWESEVLKCLDNLNGGTWTQKKLLAEIDRVGKAKNLRTTIYQREYHPELIGAGSRNPVMDIWETYYNASQQGAQGVSGPGMMKDASKNQAGAGDNALVYFDPAIWNKDNAATDLTIDSLKQANLYTGSVSNTRTSNPTLYAALSIMTADDILFHELVHAMRTLKGLTDLTATVNGWYVNVEEFMANLITNIAMNEKNPSGDLRYSENWFTLMPAKFKTNQGYMADAENEKIIKLAKTLDPQFCHTVALSPANNPFNPFRFLEKGF
jgi:hypothetical protein